MIDNNKLRFKTKIDKYDFGPYFYTVVYIPKEVTDLLPLSEYPRLRVEATVDGFPTKGALMPDKVGSKQTEHLLKNELLNSGMKIWYLQTPKKLLTNINKNIDDIVEVELSIGNQDEVDMHPALVELLLSNPRLDEVWQGLTPGKQRSLAYPILKAKTDVTIEKRLIEIEEALISL